MANCKHMFVPINNKLLLSCVGLSTGVALFLGAHPLLHYVLQLSITLTHSSPLFHLWKENPVPFYLKLYAYNWTNPEDLYKPHVKPKFDQIGPFVFKEIKQKGNVTFHANETVSFRQYHTYFFQRDLSVADLSINITTINPVMTGIAYTAEMRNWGYFMRKGMQFSFSQFKQSPIVSKPFSAYLFDGYDDIFITLGRNIPFLQAPAMDKFGWFYKRNGSTYEGDFNMGTSYHNMGMLQTWNYATTTPKFEGECGNLEGTSAGELYRPERTKETISFLSPDMCRSVPLDFDEEVTFEGVPAYKYSVGASFLDNGTRIPENKCFCVGECLPSGAVNISTCKYGAPGFVTLPNFYGADEYYTNAIEGAHPQKDTHGFFIILEPTTGLPLRVAARLQLNLYLQPVRHINAFESVPRVLFPIFWFEEDVSMPPNIIMLLKVVLSLPAILQVVGALLTTISFYFIARILKCTAREKKMDKGTIKEMEPLQPPQLINANL